MLIGGIALCLPRSERDATLTITGVRMPTTPLPHHLAALWFADIVGYSARTAEDEQGALQLVEILQRLARSTVQQYQGRIVKFIGDAVLAEFPSTELAVRAASELIEQYAEQSGKTGRAYDLRIGVHIGDVAVGPDGDLYGDGVNTAARVEAEAEPGQIIVSEDVWRQLRGRGGFHFESLGERPLKGVGSIALYVVSREEETSPPVTNVETKTQHDGKQGIRSIAVLPFADLSAERDQEYFSDGVAEEILNALTKVGDLHVPARTSCFAFRGKNMDAREIGKRLAVETLLEGSIRKAGDRLRITVQLIDARNGYHLWSERFDRQLEDIFEVQDEISRSVLEALGLSLVAREERGLLKPSTTNLEAYDFYLRGRKLFQKWTRQSGESARRMFERAIELDSNFAAAWAGLATTLVHLFRWGSDPDLKNAHKASDRALKLDPDLAEAHVARGQAFSQERRFEDAAIEFDRAIELDPTLFDALYYYARSSIENGKLEKAIRLFEQAHRARPEDYESLFFRAQALTELGRRDEAHRAYQEALTAAEKYLELNPDEARAYSLGAGALAVLGDRDRARRWNEQAISLAPDDPSILYNAGCYLALLGEDERALDAIERALNGRLGVGAWIEKDPDFARLRNHPRFQALVKRITPS